MTTMRICQLISIVTSNTGMLVQVKFMNQIHLIQCQITTIIHGMHKWM